VLDQHVKLDFYSASSLKQQSAGRHVAPLEHNLSESEPTSLCSFFLMTRPGLEPTIYCTRGEYANHYTTDTVQYI
jgi:hypothetical protein